MHVSDIPYQLLQIRPDYVALQYMKVEGGDDTPSLMVREDNCDFFHVQDPPQEFLGTYPVDLP